MTALFVIERAAIRLLNDSFALRCSSHRFPLSGPGRCPLELRTGARVTTGVAVPRRRRGRSRKVAGPRQLQSCDQRQRDGSQGPRTAARGWSAVWPDSSKSVRITGIPLGLGRVGRVRTPPFARCLRSVEITPSYHATRQRRADRPGHGSGHRRLARSGGVRVSPSWPRGLLRGQRVGLGAVRPAGRSLPGHH